MDLFDNCTHPLSLIVWIVTLQYAWTAQTAGHTLSHPVPNVQPEMQSGVLRISTHVILPNTCIDGLIDAAGEGGLYRKARYQDEWQDSLSP